MVRIRLRRHGAKKQPTYRVVVADSHSPRDGRFIENIGFYNPRTDPPTIRIEGERALYWLGQGAQPSDAVLRMLKKTGVWHEFKGIEFDPGAAAGTGADVTEAEVEEEAEATDAVESEAEESAAPAVPEPPAAEPSESVEPGAADPEEAEGTDEAEEAEEAEDTADA